MKTVGIHEKPNRTKESFRSRETEKGKERMQEAGEGGEEGLETKKQREKRENKGSAGKKFL